MNTKLDSIGETLDMLKRIERIEQLQRYNRNTDINKRKTEYQRKQNFKIMSMTEITIEEEYKECNNIPCTHKVDISGKTN
jgi:hypothetical protein